MSGGQISTVATVGPSVCLLTKEDSLSYNRLIPPPPKDFNLISNENRSNHSFVGGVMVFVSLSAPTTTTWNISRVTLAGEGSNGTHWLWRMTNWQAFIAYRCAIFSSPSIFPQCETESLRAIFVGSSECRNCHVGGEGGLEERQQRQTALRKQINVYQRLIVQLNHLNP